MSTRSAGTVDITKLWGKSAGLESPYPLLAHLVDTAAAAYSLLTDHLPTNTVRALGVQRNDEASIRRFAAFAGLHDLGKATPDFQRKDHSRADVLSAAGFEFPAGAPLRHERCTQLTLIEANGGPVEGVGDPMSGLLGASCMLGGHHGTFHATGADEIRSSRRASLTLNHPALGTTRWAEARAALLETLCSAARAPSLDHGPDGAGLVIGAGLVVLADWIASQTRVIGTEEDWPDWEALDWQQWFVDKVACCDGAIRQSGVGRARLRNVGFEQTFGFPPRSLQSSLEAHLSAQAEPGGIVLVTAPMGVGKTEAALRASRLLGGEDSGLLFLLPTMATADAMFTRVTDYAQHIVVGDEAVVGLVHSMASLNEAYSSLPDRGVDPISDDRETRIVAAAWLRGRQRTLLAPFAVATIDQLLAASLRSRRGFLRWLGLSGKTVVIDEAHSFDAYMNGLLATAMQWLGRFGVPVVVMSATLPSRVSAGLVRAWCEGAQVPVPDGLCPYPGWLHVDASGVVTTETVASPPVNLGVKRIDVAGWAERWTAVVLDRLRVVEHGGAALVVCNTVAEAQALTESLVPWARANDVDLSCLHARYPQAQRRDITNRIVDAYGRLARSRPERSVVVGTQIVEQSLDVDFDLVISCLAPVAQLLQRAGRGHRHPRPRPARLDSPTLEVLVPVSASGEPAVPRGWASVYPAVYLERTVDACLDGPDRGTWRLPDDVQTLVDSVYGTLADIEDAATDDPLTRQADREWSEQQLHLNSRIPAPDNVAQLAQLTADADETLMLSTRLGVESLLVVCAWQSPDGLTLDRAGTVPLPAPANDENTRALIAATVPLRCSRATDEILEQQLSRPDSWADNPWLAGAGLLVFDPDTSTAHTDQWAYRLDPLVGLTQERRA